MTDATAGRGGVGIRLYTSGGELVRRTFGQVSDSGKKMWAEIALGQKATNPAFRALSAGMNEAKGGLDGLASRAGIAGNALGAFGFAGVAAAGALGALAMAVTASFDAMHRAADLTDAADRIGVTTTELQRWGYVADEAGVSSQSFQSNLEKLNGVLGAFKLGIGDAKLKPVFEELGITKAQLDNVQTADQLMLLLADTLGQVKDRAVQVKLARSIGIEESLPIIRLGSAEIKRMGDAAEGLGLVLDADLNKRLDESDRKMEIAGQQMRILRDTAVGPLGEAFADATGYLAGLAVEFSKIEAKTPQWVQMLNALGRALPLSGQAQRISEYVTGQMGRSRKDRAVDPLDGYDLSGLAGDLALIAGTGRPGGYGLKGHEAAGGGSNAAAAKTEREAEQRRQRTERYEAQRDRLHEDILQSESKLLLSIDDEAAVDTESLERERKAKLKEILAAQAEYVRTNGLKGLSETEAAQLVEAQNYLSQQKKDVREWERRRDVAAYRLRVDEDVAQSAVDMLRIEGDLATTQAERYRLEREILISTQAIARKREEARLAADNNMSPEDRTAALNRFDALAGGQVRVLDYDESERLREQFKSYGREVAGAIKDGRLGEYIGDQLKAKLLDGALNALFNMMSGGGKSEAGGGFLNSALKFGASLFSKGGGRASGGDAKASFAYGLAEHGPELLMLSGDGHITSAAETAKMVRDMAGGTQFGGADGSRTVVHEHHYHQDFRGAVMTQDLLDQMNAKADRAEQRAVGRAVDSVRRSSPGAQQRLGRLGTS